MDFVSCTLIWVWNSLIKNCFTRWYILCFLLDLINAKALKSIYNEVYMFFH